MTVRYFSDSVGGGVRLAIGLSRQVFIFWLVLLLPHSDAASVFQVLSINSIFSFLLGGERYFAVMEDKSDLVRVFGKTLSASAMIFPIYLLAVWILFPDLFLEYGSVGVIVFYSAAVYDALASNEQKVFTYLGSGAFDDLNLNLLRNVLPIFVCLMVRHVFDIGWVLALFAGAGLLNAIYIARWAVGGCRGLSVNVLDRSQLKLLLAGLAVRGNVLFDRYVSGIFLGDSGVVAVSLIQSVVSTLGGFVDTSFSKRITGSGKFVRAIPARDVVVRAALLRARIRSFLNRVDALPVLWLVVSFAACVAVLSYKSVPLNTAVAVYFCSYFIFACYAHFMGVFSVCVVDPWVNVYAPVARLLFMIPVLSVGWGVTGFCLFASVFSIVVSTYLVFSGFRLSPLAFISPYKLFR